MMNKQKPNPLHKLKCLLLPPAALALALLLSTSSRAEAGKVTIGLNQSETEPRQQLVQKEGLTLAVSAPDSIAYFVDGKRMPSESIKSLDPNQIEKMDVLKGEKAQAMVSDKSIKGVVTITTKKGGKDASQNAGEAIETLPRNAIYLIDDKEVSREAAVQLAPNAIKKVSVIKDSEEMVQKYGAKARNGVILIHTKKQ